MKIGCTIAAEELEKAQNSLSGCKKTAENEDETCFLDQVSARNPINEIRENPVL